MSDAPNETKTHYVSPFPDQGGLYLLVVGIVLGVLLGPAVLGRVSPKLYERAFVGGGEFAQQLADEQDQTRAQLEALESTGVTEVAIGEQLLGREQQLVVLKAQLDQARREHLGTLVGWTTALTLAVIAVMMIESLVSPEVAPEGPTRVGPALGRLIAARYALAALWIAVMLAQPELLKQMPVLFAGLLVVVAVGVALTPLGKKT